MKSTKLFSHSVILTALLASLCCITPVLAVLGGLGGIASTFFVLEPLRPYFIAFTVIILGFAFYNAYKPKKNDGMECDCEDEESTVRRSFINSKAFLWMVAVVAAILITFPYYSQVFFPEPQKTSLMHSNHIVEARINIEGMTCISCEHAVDYALQSEQGVLRAKSSYKTGIAEVQFDKGKIQSEQLKRAVEEKAGYRVKKIQIVDKQ